ncbi:diphosphomevalonate decarboxylase [Streptomyces sp. NPDC058486]|uniref:diphosphomevalonate decarboxylase n=1 Tax=unclassified Streptomyces TaxID=2593676 RepID=UPI00365654F2
MGTDDTGTTTGTAIAHPNIALVKYWGKRDEDLILPYAPSLSLTLDVFPTTTSVRLAPGAGADTVVLDGAMATGSTQQRVSDFLDLVRERAGRSERAVVETRNTVPTGAGLASSSSGFAALALAASTAYGLTLDRVALSRLARRGSGSACRSVWGGYALWRTGEEEGGDPDLDSYAVPVLAAEMDLALVISIVESGPKAVSSREAMRHTVATSPCYQSWAASNGSDLDAMHLALRRGDPEAVGEIAERSALGMHATMLAARPAVRYWTPATLAVLDAVLRLRHDGVSAYASIDAGPNVKVLCRGADAALVSDVVREATACRLVVARPGPGARLLADGRDPAGGVPGEASGPAGREAS